MTKYIEQLAQLPFDILHIAQSYASDGKSPKIEPAHLLRALLHKSSGMAYFIEDVLDEDYYYIVDWADMHIRQCPRSAYGMKGVELSHESETTVKEAGELSKKTGQEHLTSECLLAALLTPGVAFSYEQLKTVPFGPEKILKALTSGRPAPQPQAAPRSADNAADGYCIPMFPVADASPCIGLEGQMRSMAEVLARKDRANLMIIGETGVGKTRLIEGFLRKIQEGAAPGSLSGIEPYELDTIALSQGVSYKGEIEDRFKKVADRLSEKAQPLLVIDNFHRIADSSPVLNGILPGLKKLLSGNQIQLICTSTVEGYTKYIETDKELTAYFDRLTVEEPSEESSTQILRSKIADYEGFHHLKVHEDVPPEIVRLAKRYMPDRRLPSSAIDLLDRAMASVKVEHELSGGPEAVGRPEVRDVVSKMTGIPMGNIQSEEREKLTHGEAALHKRVVGQDHAIKSVLDAIYESRSGLNKKGQPLGSFFFLGPTGTGKTELAKSLAEFLFNDETAMLRFDMSEYKEEHSVALLYGAPPGYVGYEEGGLLVNQIRQHPYSVVLFDEIEKAHRSVFDLFLQILDEGKLHDRLGRTGDFSNSLIIFTSNIGSDYIFKSFSESKVPTHDQLLEVMQGQFRPEFLARLTEIVPFSPITAAMIDRIFDIHINNLLKTLKEQNIELKIDQSARDYITRTGFNAQYGARPILGIIRKEIRRPLSKLIIAGEAGPGDVITMRYDEENHVLCWDIDSPDESNQTNNK